MVDKKRTGVMNSTPQGERVRIAFFGRRNVGKSSLVNVIAGQDVSIVTDVPGTTTDPVRKAMELLPLGPVLLIDTAGLDDEQEGVGGKRIERAYQELRSVDIAVVVSDTVSAIDELEKKIIAKMQEGGIAFLYVVNKKDELEIPENFTVNLSKKINAPVFAVSARTGEGIDELKKAIANTNPIEPPGRRIIGDRLARGDVVVLVTPIDSSAPKGRLILPQQQTIRDILDSEAITVISQVAELEKTLSMLKEPPTLVVTDSQVFAEVRDIVPQSVELTSFSILFAKYKGDFDILKDGTDSISGLKDGDLVLIAEGCTHHRQCDDIGTVKIPKWLMDYTGKELIFETTSGVGWPEDLKKYALVIHCGGCMLAKRELRKRISEAKASGVPIANYGLLIAKVKGILLPSTTN
jgi:[FeFe] hydrogenase H-cluster maturation GTPase HydF